MSSPRFPEPYEHRHPPFCNIRDLNVKEEEELWAILDHLAAQDKALIEIHRQLAAIRNDRERLNGTDDPL